MRDHEWIEDVCHCVCCWSRCVQCRACKCQVKTARRRRGAASGCPGAIPGEAYPFLAAQQGGTSGGDPR